ncbi:peptidase M22 [Caproiciproducens sp.]|uniref:peptidase M22 n=1 Tax=Caproiciproducens sp. TaxID=1954376 RepID=UPI0028A2BD21|nr:peptidase M22 [Caproiciproducens sp.]
MKRIIDTLGVDTSNYTTSAALFQNGEIFQQKMLLPVKRGELGLRQSDAVFHHVQQLPQVLEALLHEKLSVGAVGASSCPRDLESSYMPCFTVGLGFAKAVALSLGVPFYTFSHQAGHIAAALYSAGQLALLHDKFIAFHVSGGTTEAVLVTPDEQTVFRTEIVAQSLDLKGGQAVDRVGAMLGLPFPSGKALEQLALKTDVTYQIKPSLKGADCSLSGVENKCANMLNKGAPKEEIAAYCLYALMAVLDAMTAELLKQYGKLPLLFAGGVMSNSLIRDAMTVKYGAYFAAPEFSADNAAGIAVLTSIKGA